MVSVKLLTDKLFVLSYCWLFLSLISRSHGIFYFQVCKYGRANTSDGAVKYYTMGLQRTAQFQISDETVKLDPSESPVTDVGGLTRKNAKEPVNNGVTPTTPSGGGQEDSESSGRFEARRPDHFMRTSLVFRGIR